jgi:hypothetical protein
VVRGAKTRIMDITLSRLQTCMGRLTMPSARCRDIELLEGQIELRRLALRDIAVIRSRLRSCRGGTSQKVRRPTVRRRGRSRLGFSLVRPSRRTGARV